ncbi:MAG: DUF1684 domain-containing protein [Acidobacteriota bacterium]
MKACMALLPVVLSIACSSGPSAPVDQRPYQARLQAARAAKDDAMRAADNPYSPVPAAQRASFPGVAYFPINESYHVPAALTEIPSNPPVMISVPNSAHQLEQKVKVGSLKFTIGGVPYSLSAFAEDAGDVRRLWVPFRDLTSGSATYGGGRYVDLERTPTGLYDLDFNTAYQPNCVYDSNWVCPYPPNENRLPIAVEAGERLRQ